MYRKVLPVVIGIIHISIAQAAHAQNPVVAPASIVDISSIISFEKGLYIIDAYNAYTEDGFVKSLTSNVYVSANPFDSSRLINEDTILGVDSIRRDEGGWALYFYHFGKGLDIFMITPKETADSKFRISNSPRILGYLNGILIVRMTYAELVEHQYIPHNVIFRVSGDWEQFGVDVPDSKPSADLNGDGKVNQADLVLFMGQWSP